MDPEEALRDAVALAVAAGHGIGWIVNIAFDAWEKRTPGEQG